MTTSAPPRRAAWRWPPPRPRPAPVTRATFRQLSGKGMRSWCRPFQAVCCLNQIPEFIAVTSPRFCSASCLTAAESPIVSVCDLEPEIGGLYCNEATPAFLAETIASACPPGRDE